jgi:hypothetical protein
MTEPDDSAQAAPALSEAEQAALLAKWEWARERVIQAEMKVAAILAGIRDLDALKMANLDAVTVAPDGEVSGVAPAIEALRQAKPYLFRPASASASSTAAPPPASAEKRSALSMSSAEYLAAKARLLARLR